MNPLLLEIALAVFALVALTWIPGVRRWREVAEAHPETSDPVGESFPLAGMRIGTGFGSFHDRNFIAVVGPAGLSLRALPLLRRAMPPIFLPWSAFMRGEVSRGWWQRGVVFLDLDDPPYRLAFSGGLAQAIRRHAVDLLASGGEEAVAIR